MEADGIAQKHVLATFIPSCDLNTVKILIHIEPLSVYPASEADDELKID